MAKSRKGNAKADDRFNARMLLGEFLKQIAEGEPSQTPQGMLIELMNGDSLTSESKTRIERIIQLLRGQKEYQALISARIRAEPKSSASVMHTLTTEALMLTLLDMSRGSNRLLALYVGIPQIQPLWPEPRHYFLPADSFSLPVDSMEAISAKQAEVGAVLTVVQLAQRNQLQDVKVLVRDLLPSGKNRRKLLQCEMPGKGAPVIRGIQGKATGSRSK